MERKLVINNNNISFFYKKIQENSGRVTLVLSTDVFIEGVLNAESYSGQLIDYLIEERFDIAMDDRIYLEYSAKLDDKKLGLEKKSVNYLLKFLEEKGQFVTADKLKTKEINLGDNYLKFVEVARSSYSNAIIILERDILKFAYINLLHVIMTPEEVYEKLL